MPGNYTMKIKKIIFSLFILFFMLSGCKSDSSNGDDDILLLLMAGEYMKTNYSGSCETTALFGCVDYFVSFSREDAISNCTDLGGTYSSTVKCATPTIGSCKTKTETTSATTPATGTGNYHIVGSYYTGSTITEAQCINTLGGTWSTGSQTW